LVEHAALEVEAHERLRERGVREGVLESRLIDRERAASADRDADRAEAGGVEARETLKFGRALLRRGRAVRLKTLKR
jgi:hypothetical protein